MTDLILAILHHLGVFALAGVLAMEAAILRPGIAGKRLQELGALDISYGALAGLIVVVGFLRVFFGAADSGFYLGNPVFWTKIALFVVLGLLSVVPTIAIIGWRRSAKDAPDFSPPIAAVARVRTFLHLEIGVFVLIPIAAAAMARGYGL